MENRSLKLLLKEVAVVISGIQNDNLNVELSEEMIQSNLGNSIQSLLGFLRKIKIEEANRTWFNNGLNLFLEILRSSNVASLDRLLDQALSELIKYIQANQGAIFILRDECDERYLEMVACYAYNRKKYLGKRQFLGEGLAGQCVLERDTIYLRNIPANYVNITSGLGEATPRNILITPLIINEEVVGVVELAALNELSNNCRDFIRKISESLASVIKSGQENKKMENILRTSQNQTEVLKAQEEEMRQNLEVMGSMQEQLARSESELKRKLEEMEQALIQEKSSEIAKIREDERKLLESKLETQKHVYELIINKLKSKLKAEIEV